MSAVGSYLSIALNRHEDVILFGKKSIEMSQQLNDTRLEMEASLLLSNSYSESQKFNKSLFYSQKAINAARISGYQDGEMAACLSRASAYNSLEQYDNAIILGKKCVDLALSYIFGRNYFETKKVHEMEKEQSLILPGAYFILAEAHLNLKEYEDCIISSKKAITMAKTLQTVQKSEEKGYFLLGQAYKALNRYDECTLYWQKCIKFAELNHSKNTTMSVHKLLGQLYLDSLKNYDHAMSHFKKCLEDAKETGNVFVEMLTNLEIARIYYWFEDVDNAILHIKRSLATAEEIGDKNVEAKANLELGKCYDLKKDYGDAMLFSNKSIDIAKQIGNKVVEANAYLVMARVHSKHSKHDDAITGNERCNDIAKEIGEETSELTGYLQMGETYFDTNRCEEAIFFTKKCTTMARRIGNKYLEMKAWRLLGKIYEKLQQYHEVVWCTEKCVGVVVETEEKMDKMNAYSLLGRAYYFLKQYHDSINNFHKCIDFAKKMEKKITEMYTLGQIGKAFFLLNKYDDAIASLKRSVEMAEGDGDEYSDAKVGVYYLLAKSYSHQAKLEDAIDYCKICIEIAKEISIPLMEAKALSLCASSLISLNQYGEAYSHITEGLRIAINLTETNFLIDEFTTLLRILYESVGMTTEEIACKRNLRIYDIENDELKDILGKITMCYDRYFHHRSQKNYEEAIACLEDAMRAAVPDRQGDLLFFANTAIFQKDIAEMYVIQGQYDTALLHYQEGLALAQKFDLNKHHQALIHFGIAEVYYILKQTGKAERSLRESIKCFELMFSSIGNHDQFKIAIVDKYNHVHKLLLKVLIETNKNEEALVLADHFRALALKDILVSNYGMKEETAKDDLQYTEVQQLVSTNNYAILLFSVCFGEMYTFLVEAGDEFPVRSFKYSDKCFDKLIEKSYSEMKVRQVVNCEDRSLDTLMDREVKDDSSINIRVNAKEPSENSEDISETNASEIFYHRILPKLILQATPEEIVILPDGSLHKVPFAALRDPDTGRYLSETKRIRLAPSIATLKLLSENAENYHNNRGALIIGNPLVGKVMFDGEETEFPSLENAFAEVLLVSKVFGETPLIGEKATKPAVIQRLQEGVSVVHIAAHGSLTKGTIALAPSPEIRATKLIPDEEDYMLTMADVQQAKVRAKLVVLSCCHSGRGEIRAEGVIGMCRAFLASGARAVVASLWAIDDEATADFMFKFYIGLMDGKSAGASLQQAMGGMRNVPDYGEPKYWAPFFLMGDDVSFKT